MFEIGKHRTNLVYLTRLLYTFLYEKKSIVGFILTYKTEGKKSLYCKV